MATLGEFGDWAIDYGTEVPKRANATKQEVSKIIQRDLVEITPVDISTALSNWQVGIGGLPIGPIDAYIPGSFGSTEKQSEGIAIEQALIYIAASEPGESIHIVNEVPYIEDLNDGSSQQAPKNFVDGAVLLGESFVRRNGLVDVGK
jgi:hypothetical protein